MAIQDGSSTSLSDINTTQQNGVIAINRMIQVLQSVLPLIQSTSTSASAGAASALPATPAGYLTQTLPDGTSIRVPYYLP